MKSVATGTSAGMSDVPTESIEILSAIIEPDGTIVERTAISEARVLQGEVELREGNTWATRFTWYPMFFIAFAAYAVAWIMARSESDRVMSTS